MQKSTSFNLILSGMAYGGDAVSRLPDGRMLFVPYGLPGEQVRVRIVEEKKRQARGVIEEILTPSPLRIPPRCAHFGICVNCQYQHILYSEQLKIKEAILREMLEKTGIQNPPIRQIQPAPDEWNYRNLMQLNVTSEGKLAFLSSDGDGLLAISECHLPEARLGEIWPALEFEPGSGLEAVELSLGSGEEVLLVLEGSEPNPPELTVELPISVVYAGSAGDMGLAGENYSVVELLGRPFRISLGTFIRTNTRQTEALLGYMLEKAGPLEGATVLDVYCGAGIFSAFLADKALKVVGVELSEEACEDFAANLDEFENVELYQGRAEQILPAMELKPQLIIVDPPGEGMEKPALDALLRMAAPRLVYCSGNPETLSRDILRIVKGGYRLIEVIPFDFAPQTFEIEAVAVFGKD